MGMLEIAEDRYIEVNRIEAINLIMMNPVQNERCTWEIQVNGQIYGTPYFNNKEEARKWLKEKKLL